MAKWLRKEGDAVAVGDPLVELETDKIDLEVAAPQAGVLKRIDREDGEDVKVGEVLGVIEERRRRGDGGSDGGSARPRRRPPTAQPRRAAGSCRGRENARDTDRAQGGRGHEVDLSRVRGSGDAGRVMLRDVEQAAAGSEGGRTPDARTPAAAPPTGVQARPAPPSPKRRRPAPASAREERVRMSKRRATIARRLVEAQSTAAMLTTFNEVDMSAVMALRERHKQAFKERHGVGLGIASFFVKASIGALRAFPRINAEIQGDEMVLKHYYDIGVAVGASEGLVVPVLRDADRMSFAEIEQQIRDFAKRAEDGTLSLADLKGGTFTITNGGVFGRC